MRFQASAINSFAIAEDAGLHRASFGARRLSAGLDAARSTGRTSSRRAPAWSTDSAALVGASQHAVAAANTFVGVVDDRAEADLLMAPTGHAEAQAGSSQCMQILRTNLSPRVSTTVKAVSESVGSGSVLNP